MSSRTLETFRVAEEPEQDIDDGLYFDERMLARV